MIPTPDLSPAAVSEWVESLARFGAPGAGVTRLVYDEHWCDAQAWMAARAEERGLAATRDRAGNLYLHDPAVKPGDAVFLTGSHLDTVREGGKLDGAYGALAGLLLAAALRGATRVPVVGLVTCEEEGSRFPSAFLGARAMLGRVAAGEPETARDGGGVTWQDALAAAAARGCAAPGDIESGPTCPFRAAGFLELHIEQGPVLENGRLALGVVDRIAGFRRVRATFTGEARHAGTTPMRLRRDALASAAELALAAERIAIEHGEPAVATAGGATARPGLFNVVPGSCELKLDIRHVELDSLERLLAAIETRAREIALRRETPVAWEIVSQQNPVPMDADFAADALELAGARGVPHRRMPSGAGHDAMILGAAGIPSLMLFVPSRDGISHSPDEWTDPRDLAAGIGFAHELLPKLAARVGVA